MKVSIARALTLKKRLVGRLNVVNSRIQSNNSRVQGSQANYDVAALMQQRAEMIAALIDLKVAIQVTNRPILGDIYRLSEAKTEMAFYAGLDTKAGQEINLYGRADMQMPIYEAVVSRTEADEKAIALEQEIDTIQQKLESFNHTTQVEIPDLQL